MASDSTRGNREQKKPKKLEAEVNASGPSTKGIATPPPTDRNKK